MRNVCAVILWAALLSINLSAATIEVDVSPLGPGGPGESLFRYTFSISDETLMENEEIAIRFNPSQFSALSNGVAPSDFDLLLFQPDNPPGSFGSYSLLSLVNNPSLAGPFRVDASVFGQIAPVVLPFSINQYDDSGAFLGTRDSGFTQPGGVVIPEPGTLLFGGAGILAAVIARLVQRRSGRCGQRSRSA